MFTTNFSMVKPGPVSYKRTIFVKYLPLLLFLLTTALVLWQLAGVTAYTAYDFSYYADRGEILFHAVRDHTVSYSMPFLSMAASFVNYHLFTGQSHSPDNMAQLARVASLLLYVLCYNLGAISGGRVKGLLYALVAVLLNFKYEDHDGEQAIYSLLLVLYVNLEVLRAKNQGVLDSLLAGLSLGFTLLVRSPLFLFPLLKAVWDFFESKTDIRKYFFTTALFLSAVFILLLPWSRLNYFHFDRIIPFEVERSAANMITGAKGSVFTMEGDHRSLAGLSQTDNVTKWAVKTVLADPLNYVSGIAKRLWHVFLMFPILIPLAIAGALLARRRMNLPADIRQMPRQTGAIWSRHIKGRTVGHETSFIAMLAVYFVLVHCLLSIEARFMYPLRYFLGFMLSAGLWRLLERDHGGRPAKGLTAYILFAVITPFVCVVEYHVIRYPHRAELSLAALNEELRFYPDDPWLLKKKGRVLLLMNETKDGLAILDSARLNSKGNEQELSYILKTLESPAPKEPPDCRSVYTLFIVKLLRELELGRLDAAKKTVLKTKEIWERDRSGLSHLHYKKDFSIQREIRATDTTLWNRDIPDALLYWPPEKRHILLEKLAGITGLRDELRDVAADAARQAALSCQAQGHYREALLILDNALKDLPASPPLYNDRGVVFRFLKQNKKAKECFIKSLTLAPDQFNAAINLAGIYTLEGETDKAAAIYKNLLAAPGMPEEMMRHVRSELAGIGEGGKL